MMPIPQSPTHALSRPSLRPNPSPGFRSGSPASGVDHVGQLVSRASNADRTAIEDLVQFSLGGSGQETAKAATQALLALYGDSNVNLRVRESIGAAVYACFLRLERADQQKPSVRWHPAPKTDGESTAHRGPAHMPTETLYLAGCDATDTSTRSAIERQLQARCFPSAIQGRVGEPDLLAFNRLVRSEELSGASAGFQALPVHRTHPETQAANFGNQVQELDAFAMRQKKPVAAYLNTGNHWVALILDSTKEHKRYLIIDSHWQTRKPEACAALQALKKVVPAHSKIFLAGGDLQTNTPNACGPLAFQAVSDLNDYLAQNANANFEALATATGQKISAWEKLSVELQIAQVTVNRARLLAALGAQPQPLTSPTATRIWGGRHPRAAGVEPSRALRERGVKDLRAELLTLALHHARRLNAAHAQRIEKELQARNLQERQSVHKPSGDGATFHVPGNSRGRVIRP